MVKVAVRIDNTRYRQRCKRLGKGANILCGHAGVDHESFVCPFEQIAVTARSYDTPCVVSNFLRFKISRFHLHNPSLR